MSLVDDCSKSLRMLAFNSPELVTLRVKSPSRGLGNSETCNVVPVANTVDFTIQLGYSGTYCPTLFAGLSGRRKDVIADALT